MPDTAPRVRAPRKPTTVIGTLQRVQKILEEHTPAERAKILTFLSDHAVTAAPAAG